MTDLEAFPRVIWEEIPEGPVEPVTVSEDFSGACKILNQEWL